MGQILRFPERRFGPTSHFPRSEGFDGLTPSSCAEAIPIKKFHFR